MWTHVVITSVEDNYGYFPIFRSILVPWKKNTPSDSGIASRECLLWSQHLINLNFIVDNLRRIRLTVLQRGTLAITFAQRPNAAIHTFTNEKDVIKFAKWSENSVISTIRNDDKGKKPYLQCVIPKIGHKNNLYCRLECGISLNLTIFTISSCLYHSVLKNRNTFFLNYSNKGRPTCAKEDEHMGWENRALLSKK